MRVSRLYQWVLGIALLLAGCSLNPQPFPPEDFSNDAGATGNSDSASQSPDAGLGTDASKDIDSGTDADADAGLDAPIESGEAGDAALDALAEGG